MSTSPSEHHLLDVSILTTPVLVADGIASWNASSTCPWPFAAPNCATPHARRIAPCSPDRVHDASSPQLFAIAASPRRVFIRRRALAW